MVGLFEVSWKPVKYIIFGEILVTMLWNRWFVKFLLACSAEKNENMTVKGGEIGNSFSEIGELSCIGFSEIGELQ